MEIRTARDLGFLGTNVDQNLTLDFVHYELVQKAEQGDKTSVFKMHQIVRHYVGENQETIRKYVSDALIRLGELEAPKAGAEDDKKGETPDTPSTGGEGDKGTEETV